MKLSSIGIGVLSAALLCGSASAAETDYSAGARALPLQQEAGTARAMAMGSAVVAVPQGSASLLWNPAGLSRMSCSEIGLHHNSGLADTIQEIAVLGIPLGEVKDDGKGGSLGGFAASLGYVNYGSFAGRDTLGNPTDNYHAGDFSGSAGWGMELLPNIAGGVDVKVNRSDFGDKAYNAYAGDVGVLWKVIPAVDLGLTYANFNLGPKVGGNQLVQGWRLGAAWKVYRHWLLAAAGELQNSAMNRMQLGTEYLIGNIRGNAGNVLALRAGFQANYPNPQLTGLTGLTFGLGYTITRALALDYAMVPVGSLGVSHRVSLTFKFGCPQKPEPPVAAAAPAPVVAAAPVLAAAAYVAPPEPVVAPAPPPPVVYKSMFLEDSHFDFDKSTLKPEGMAALRDNVQLLKETPGAKVRVAGYTSMRGKAEYNQKLSERRAVAVQDYLISQGVMPGRISTIGYGETRPALEEVSAAKKYMNADAAKANMRVLFEITVN
ncbi:MAG: PorV/PorQ family protein [Elusimicrobia bacterium]|nr:PorV/PorQ family protein [Elusimicrobiota bacterium]